MDHSCQASQNMAMNHFRSNTNNIFLNHQQLQLLINYFPPQQTMPAAASTFFINHGIFSFTIPTTITLVQVRFPDQHLFHTNPILILLMLCSTIAYSLAFSLELLLRGPPHADVVRPRSWSMASGSLSLNFEDDLGFETLRCSSGTKLNDPRVLTDVGDAPVQMESKMAD